MRPINFQRYHQQKWRGSVEINKGEGTTYGIIPVSKPIGVVVGISANHRDKGVHYQSYHEEDLEHGHIKLRGSKPANCKSVKNT